MQSDLTQDLNPEQLTAVSMGNYSALIVAGAGSGKTRVLIARIAWLIQQGMAQPNNILAVTFTNKAAKEMLNRLYPILPLSLKQIWIGTFHSLCYRMLRIHYHEALLSEHFQIIDMQDQLRLLKRLLKDLKVNEEVYPAKMFQYCINQLKDHGHRAIDFAASDKKSALIKTVYTQYEQVCHKESLIDFAELLLRSYELLCHNQNLSTHYQERFTHILVDEFQDTNRLQYAWLKLLAASKNSVFAVGDDDQSIYAFRGAEVGNIASFQQDFHIKKVVRLEQNYRSHGNILDAANAVIAHNKGRIGKELWTQLDQGKPIQIFKARTDFEEGDFIVSQIQSLSREKLTLDKIAILYRSNAQSRTLEHALFKAGIPYRVYGGLRFFERQEIKHALSYVRLVTNYDDNDALLRIINFPSRTIGDRSVDMIRQIAAQQGISLWEAACLCHSGRSATAIQHFISLIKNMRQATRNLTLTTTIQYIVDKSGLLSHYGADKDGEDRVANLKELINAASTFSSEHGDNVVEFLSHTAIEAGEHKLSTQKEEAIQLMTIHAAKGLEFHTVFITGLEEGLFPHENSLVDAQSLSEERRLMYVAITRAQRQLNLSFSQTRLLNGRSRYATASRFINEIPQKLLKWINLGYSPLSNLQTTSSKSSNGFRVGQNVQHPKFGRGVVTGLEGDASHETVEVHFQQYGKKWLAVAYAKLQIIVV